MAVDAARQNQLSGGIDLAGSGCETAAEGHDDAVLDADIAFARVGRGRHRAATDHQVKLAHAVSLSISAVGRPSLAGCAVTVKTRPGRRAEDTH
jgi:hypothetical protein